MNTRQQESQYSNMSIFIRKTLLNFSVGILILISSCSQDEKKSADILSYVDPNIGGVGHTLKPTRPTVQLPNQIIRMYPVREDYLDDQITGFPLTIISHRRSSLFELMPFSGELPGGEKAISAWDKQNEMAKPHYYFVWLEDYEIELEFVPGAKTGYFRIKYPEAARAGLQLTVSGDGYLDQISESEISGEITFQGMKAYAYGRFSQSLVKLDDNSALQLTFPDGSDIDFRYAISYISLDQAKKNLSNEMPDWTFEKYKSAASDAWQKVLGQIVVEGGTDARKRTFYTALYRTYERMVNITEEGRYYSAFDGKVHEGERPFYVDDWVWDSYLAHHPLRTLLDPNAEADMLSSFVRQYEQSGWLPQFTLLTGEFAAMNGFHSTIALLDGYRKGITDFDVEKAYEGMKKNALEGTMLPWRKGAASELDKLYHQLGYFPALAPGAEETEPRVHDFEKRQAVAVTLGHSYDDWALSQFAKELGYQEDALLFAEKSNNYQNLYWDHKGFFMPKDAEENWIDIDPKFDGGMGGRAYYGENNGWTYLWQVQHDVAGLMELMGGKENFEKRLDQHFREGLGRSKYANWAKFPDFTGIVGQFSMGNEPSFHIPYLYNFTDSPWKTQKKIRMLLDTWFPDNVFGIPGDEDGGAMSAFVVFSCMGFYPVIPGIPVYTIGSPVFEKVSINLDNGARFTIHAAGGSDINKYIQKAWLNGKPLEGPWLTHHDIIRGGELSLEMGKRPNSDWGASFDWASFLDKNKL